LKKFGDFGNFHLFSYKECCEKTVSADLVLAVRQVKSFLCRNKTFDKQKSPQRAGFFTGFYLSFSQGSLIASAKMHSAWLSGLPTGRYTWSPRLIALPLTGQIADLGALRSAQSCSV
jgi:hypothetical protein